MVESSTDFLFGEDLKTAIFLAESDSCDESPETASMVQETPLEMQTEETETQKRSSRILL